MYIPDLNLNKMSHKVESIQWTIDGFHRPFAASCSSTDVLNKYHYVFTIPKRFFRHRATSFSHFRSNPESKRHMLCFHFFLDFMQAMISSQEKKDPQPKGKNTLGFIEWCPGSESKNELNTAGWRIHVFVDRGINEIKVLESLIRQYQKDSEKLISRNKPVPKHYHINTMASYGAHIFNVYSGSNGNFEQLYQSLASGCTVSPSSLFKMKEITGSIYSIDMYKDDTNSFVFPGTEFIRLDTEKLNAKYFSTRRLPDHVMFSLAKPEVRIFREKSTVKFLAHRYFQNYDISIADIDEFIASQGERYIINDEGSTREVFDIGEVTYTKPLHTGDVWLDTQSIDDFTGETSTAYEKMRANQHDISTIDHIALMAMQKEDPGTYIEEEFLTHVYNDEDCFASKPLKAIVRWFHKEYDPSKIKPWNLVHDKMSVIGHRACIVMEMYHHLYQVSSAHRAFYWAHIARLDAFRHQHNLHLNACWTGDAATSKSYTLTMLEKNSINDTVSNRTYDTDKADAIDSDVNHVVSMFDEAPPGMFKDPKKKGPLEALKMRLTSMKTTHRRLFTNDETGIREQIESTSSNIGCMFGATNESRSSFDAALQTRFHFFEAEKALNTTHSVANCQHAAETMGKIQKEKLKDAIMFHKFEQGFVALAWQFVRMGRIKEPNTTAVGIVVQRFEKALDSEYDIKIESRTVERIKRICQNLAIVRAKQILYYTNTGRFVNTPFHPSHIKYAEQYMICTEEIVLHAIGLEFDTIISRNRRRVLKKIWEMHKENEMYKQNDQGDEDANYLSLEGNIQSICRRLLNALIEDNIHVSVCNIFTIFTELKSQTLSCRGYTHANNNFHDGFPGYDENRKRWAAVEEIGGKLHMHLELFKDIRTSNGETNIYKQCAAKIVHEHTEEKLVVMGMNSFQNNEPNVWDTIHLKPKNGEILQMTQGIGKQDDPYNVIGKTEDLNEELVEDIDTYIARVHSEDIGYDIEPYYPNPNDWASYTIPYPFRRKKRKH